MSLSCKFRLVAPQRRQIVNHLIHYFQIPNGSELVMVLSPHGAGPACNHRAIGVWVGEQLAQIADEPVCNLLATLEERLLETLQAEFPESGTEIEIPSDIARHAQLPLPRWEPLPAGVCHANARTPRRWQRQQICEPVRFPHRFEEAQKGKE